MAIDTPVKPIARKTKKALSEKDEIEASKNSKKTKMSFSVKFQRYLRDTAITHIVLALVANTMLAQLFYNSAGLLLPDKKFTIYYLGISAIFSTVAFSLFEIRQVKAVNDMLSSGAKYSPWEWVKTIGTLLFITLYNMYALTLLNAAIWPDLHITNVPELPKPWKYVFHAVMYSAILFLAGVVGERKRSAEEEVAHVEQEIQGRLLRNASDEADALIDGKVGTNRAIIAMMVLGTPKAKKFFANFANVLGGKVTLDDVVSQGNIEGVIRSSSQQENATFHNTATLDGKSDVASFPRDSENGKLVPVTPEIGSTFHAETVEVSTGTTPMESNNNPQYTTIYVSDSQEGDVSADTTGMESESESGENKIRLLRVNSDQNPDDRPLGNLYVLPEGLTLNTRIPQAEISVYFGIATNTFNRRLQRSDFNLTVFPVEDANRTMWKVNDILYLYEHDVFNGLETKIDAMIRQDRATV